MIDAYVNRIATRYQTGIATEHSYRGDLQTLLESLNPGILVTNEPARIACGAPDFILTRQNIPVGYIEAKDIGDIDKWKSSNRRPNRIVIIKMIMFLPKMPPLSISGKLVLIGIQFNRSMF